MSSDSNKLSPLKKTLGRPIGSTNGDHRELLEQCRRRKLDVFEGILDLCKHPDPEIRGKNLARAADFLYAKRKSVEHSGSLDINIEEHRSQIESYKDKLKKARP